MHIYGKNSLSSGDPSISIPQLKSLILLFFSRTFAKPHVFYGLCIYSLPTDSAEGGAEDDVYHELRVFALRQIQSRFAGNYKNLLICRYHHHHSPPDLSSNHSRSRRRPHSHQVWTLTQFFFCFVFVKNIDLPGGQINDPSLGKHYFL